MAPKLLFGGRRLTAAKIIAASSQGTVRALQPAADRGNVGALSLVATGTPVAALNQRVEIVDPGALGTATFRVSVDGGTNYLGRKVDTVWDGNGAAERVVLDDTGDVYCSAPCAVDSDGDGVLDRVLVAIGRIGPTPDQVDIYYTTDFSGAGSWSLLAANVTGIGDFSSPALLYKAGVLYLLTDVGGVRVYKSLDCGLTWGASVTVATSFSNGMSATVLASGKLMVAYCVTVSGYSRVYCKTSADGATWTATGKQVTVTGSVDYTNPMLVQEADGKTICKYNSSTGNTVQARQTTAADPAASSASWAAYSETLWSGAAGAYPSSCIAPDGTIFAMVTDGGDLKYSKFKDGDANWSALATAYAPAGTIGPGRIAIIAGAIWCVCVNSTDDSIVLIMTKYVTTYDASTAPASWTGLVPQYIANNIWFAWGGSLGQTGDAWTIGSSYINDAGNMLRYIRNRPAKSSNNTDDWYVVIDAGVNNVFAVNGVCLAGNFEHAHFQMNATDVWTSPSLNETVDMVRATYAATTGYTLPGGGRIKFTAGGLVPQELRGVRVKFATSGTVYEITDNDADEAYVEDADVSAEAGVMSMFAPKKWIGFPVARYQYIRLLVQIQDTASGVFEVPAMIAGTWTPLANTHVVQISYAQNIDIKRFRSGQSIRAVNGDALRLFSLVMTNAADAETDEIIAQFSAHDYGVAPFALVPDSDDSFDFAVVALPEGSFDPSDGVQFSVPLEEIL